MISLCTVNTGVGSIIRRFRPTSKRKCEVNHSGTLKQLASMHPFVAFGAQCDQVLFLVATRLAAKFEMMYLQVLHVSADLAAPAVALQHLPMQLAIARRIEPDSRAFAADLPLHEAFRLTSDRKTSCCSPGRNL